MPFFRNYWDQKSYAYQLSKFLVLMLLIIMMMINYFCEAVLSCTEVLWQKPVTIFLEKIIEASPSCLTNTPRWESIPNR